MTGSTWKAKRSLDCRQVEIMAAHGVPETDVARAVGIARRRCASTTGGRTPMAIELDPVRGAQ